MARIDLRNWRLPNQLSLADKYKIDLSDAFEIESVKAGYFSHFLDESKTLLVTADRRLAEVAKLEDIKAWYFPADPIPD